MAQCIVPLPDIANASMGETMRYTDAKANTNGKGKSCGVTFLCGGEAVKLVVQSPKMWCQFGVDEYKPDDGGPPKYSIRLGFKKGVGGAMAELHKFLKAVDANNIEQAFNNQATWWPNTGIKTRDIIEDRYTAIVKASNNGQYDDQMRVKLMYKNGEYDGHVFDESQPPASVGTQYIDPKCNIIALVELGPIWIADKSFGQTVKAVQLKVFKSKQIRDYCIEDDDAEMCDEAQPFDATEMARAERWGDEM